MKSLLFAFLIALAPSLLEADEHPADLELVILAGESPLRLQLSCEIGGRSWKQTWDDIFAALVAHYDLDVSGFLNEAEARRLPSAQALREVLSLGFVPPLGEAPAWQQLDADRDDKLTAAEVATFYRGNGLAAPLVGVGAMPFTIDLTGSLVRLLDADRDDCITEEELQAAPQALPRLDRNEDELIGTGELVSQAIYPGATGSLLLTTPRKDRPLPEALAAFPLRILPSERAEDAWTELTAGRTSKFAAVCLWKADAAPGARLKLRRKGDDGQPAAAMPRLNQPGLHLSLREDAGRLTEVAERVTAHFSSEFAAADGDGDGVLTAEELNKEIAAIGDWLVDSADRDEDGRLTKAELDGWLALQARLAAAQALVTVLDGGSGLFELLDTNRDGALSSPELQDAAHRVRDAGALADSKLLIDRLPRQLLVTISHGYPRANLGSAPSNGPSWFRAMDRNADGFVSRREFSGPRDAFEKLDNDRDGMISPIESKTN